MSTTFTYAVPGRDLSQLHDALRRAGLAPLVVQGDDPDVVLTYPDGQAPAPVDAVVAAHVPQARYDPATRQREVAALRRATGRAALRARARAAATVAELRAVLLTHLTAEAAEEEEVDGA